MLETSLKFTLHINVLFQTLNRKTTFPKSIIFSPKFMIISLLWIRLNLNYYTKLQKYMYQVF